MARRQTREREHEVDVAIAQKLSLAKEGYSITFTVRSRGEIVGTLNVGRGSLSWRGLNGKKRRTLRWRQFAALMDAAE